MMVEATHLYVYFVGSQEFGEGWDEFDVSGTDVFFALRRWLFFHMPKKL